MKIEIPFLGPMDETTYRAYPALSQSKLKLMNRTPWHFKNPPPHTDSPAKQIGRIFHTRLLEPQLFDSQYLVCDLNRNTNKYKDLVAEESAGADREIIKSSQVELADIMANAVRSNRDASEFIEIPAQNEVSGICELLGRLVKIRIDRLPEIGQLWDLKTFGGEARPRAWAYRCQDLGYLIQAWMYTAVVHKITGEWRGWSWIVVEQSDQPAVQVYKADDSLLDEGRRQYETLLERLEQCEALDYWPNSYTQGPYIMIGRDEQ